MGQTIASPCGGGVAAGQMQLTDGEVGLTDAAWEKLTTIVDQMTMVDKVGAKKYEQLTEMGKMAPQGTRSLSELENCLTQLDDEKQRLTRILRFRKHKDCV